MIEDALDLSRIENNQFEINLSFIDIRQVLSEVTSIMDFQVTQKQLYLRTQIDDSVPLTLKTDVKRLRQILFNLIGNAIKFTFKGGITVSVKYQWQMQKLTTVVSDTGVGIEPEAIQKLF